jgi:hypothetical protein
MKWRRWWSIGQLGCRSSHITVRQLLARQTARKHRPLQDPKLQNESIAFKQHHLIVLTHVFKRGYDWWNDPIQTHFFESIYLRHSYQTSHSP